VETSPDQAPLEALIRKVSNWGRWGADDELGTLNFLTPRRRAAAADLIQTGRTFSLAIPLDANGPWPAGANRWNPIHTMLKTGADVLAGTQPFENTEGYADDMVCMPLQCGTQWDSLAHIFHRGKMYNDRSARLVDSRGALKNSITALKAEVAGRAVLVDLPRAQGVEWLPPGHEITPAELESALERQRVQVRAGDILLLRTGHMCHVRIKGTWAGFVEPPEPGPGCRLIQWLYEHDIAAIAADTWALEAMPSGVEGCGLPIHQVGIVYMGLLLGEIFYLDELAGDCAHDQRYDMFFCAPPLTITGAVGSPINPLAIK
jgi:kynurenine formamidase